MARENKLTRGFYVYDEVLLFNSFFVTIMVLKK